MWSVSKRTPCSTLCIAFIFSEGRFDANTSQCGYRRKTRLHLDGRCRAAVAAVVDGGAQSVVVDLRHNPGGYFPGGIDVARLVFIRLVFLSCLF